jgi:hypothetical protein
VRRLGAPIGGGVATWPFDPLAPKNDFSYE